MIVLYFCLIGIVWAESLETETISLTMVSVPKFPFQMEKPFEMTFGTNARDGILSKSIIDTMVIHIPNPEGIDEMAVFDFGFKDSIDSEFSGLFMRIPTWEKNTENGTITATVYFTKFAHNKSLGVYHISVDTSKERRDALKNLKLAKQVYRANISLMVGSRVEMFVNSNSDSVVELSTDTTHLVSCREFDGVPRNTPSLSGLKMTTTLSHVRNEVTSKFRVLPTDHGKSLICRAGTAQKNITVNVLHGPSRIELEPNIGLTMGSGGSVVCRTVDGYPMPKTSWHFVDGPEQASKYYIISYDKQSVYFKRQTPLGSNWTFLCTAWNKIKGTKQFLNRTVSFIIGNANRSENSSSPKDTQDPKVKWDKWEIKEKYNKVHMILMKRIVYKQSKDIDKLNKNIDKQNKEITKLKAAFSIGKSEISRIKSQLKRLADTQNMQNIKFLRMKRYVDEKIATRGDRAVNPNTEAPESRTWSPMRSQGRDQTVQKRMMRSFVWKIEDVLKLRAKRRFIRSKRFFLARLDRAVAMVLDFSGHRSLRLSLHMYPFRKMEGRRTVKGSFTITIADAENSSSRKTEEKSFEIGMEPIQMDLVFDYMDLVKLGVFQSDEITIKLAGSWDM